MSSKPLKEICGNERLSIGERSLQLQKEIVTLYKQIDPEDVSTVKFDYEDLKALEQHLIMHPDRHILSELLALLRNIVPFDNTLIDKLCTSSVNDTLFRRTFENQLTEDADQLTVVIFNRFLQYVANSVASDTASSGYFFRLLVQPAERPLLGILECEHEKLISVAISVLSRLVEEDSHWSALLDLDYFVRLTDALIRQTLRTSNPDAFELLRRMVEDPRLFSAHFEGFDVRSQSFLLDLVSERLTEVDPHAPTLTLLEETLQFFITRVKDHIEKFRKNRDAEDANDILFVKFITVLALASLKDSRGSIRNDLELLIMSIECLRTVHILGKKDSGEFDQKADFDSLAGNKEEIFDHPLFGLKRDLVRLIGNMCFKNKRNQDTIRDFNGIELLCDMSCLDARNPFITQWVVLALKNLTENNEENQKIVASLTKKGDSS